MRKEIRGFCRLLAENINICVICNMHLFTVTYSAINGGKGQLNTIVVMSHYIQGGSNMTGTDLCVNKPHCAAAVRH